MADQVTIARDGSNLLLSAEAGDTLSAPGVCTRRSASSVSCPQGPSTALAVDLRGGDDALTVTLPDTPALSVVASGGAGNDVLDAAGAAAGALRGDAGDDRLLAGRGAFDLTGGAGSDELTGGPAGARTRFLADAAPDGADRLLGGPGADSADYSARSTAVRLTADGVADDGAAGEGDDVAPAVETLVGGAGPDVLAGGPGPSVLMAMAGDDQLQARDDAVDQVDCGDGADVAVLDAADAANACETEQRPAPAAPPAVTIHGLPRSTSWRKLRRGLRFEVVPERAGAIRVHAARRAARQPDADAPLAAAVSRPAHGDAHAKLEAARCAPAAHAARPHHRGRGRRPAHAGDPEGPRAPVAGRGRTALPTNPPFGRPGSAGGRGAIVAALVGRGLRLGRLGLRRLGLAVSGSAASARALGLRRLGSALGSAASGSGVSGSAASGSGVSGSAASGLAGAASGCAAAAAFSAATRSRRLPPWERPVPPLRPPAAASPPSGAPPVSLACRVGASIIVMLRPSCWGRCSTTASSPSSSARRLRIISPRSGWAISRPRNMIVTLTLSRALRKRMTWPFLVS